MNIKDVDGSPRVHADGAEFLRYLLSREGQEAIQVHDCKYLPLTADEARRQLQKLDSYVD
jgi:phosphate transport system substrate-binding protein